MALIKWEYILAFIFAIFSVILLVLIGAQTQYSKSYRAQIFHEIESVDSAGFALQEIPGSPISDGTLDEYSELVERPLFFNERRPIVLSEDGIAGEPEGEQQALEDFSFILGGIINTPAGAYALFQDPNPKPEDKEGTFKRRKQGADIGQGWTLKEIKPNSVVIASEAGTLEIQLTKKRTHKKATKRKKTKRPNPFKRKINKKK